MTGGLVVLYSDARSRPPQYPIDPSPTVAVAALAYLREETLPGLIEPPRFVPRTRALPAQTEALRAMAAALRRFVALARPLLPVGAVALALTAVLATAISAWAALQPSSTRPAPPARIISSPGTTGSATTRVANLSAATFVGTAPFFAQAQYLAALEGAAPEALNFLRGAQEAPMIDYMRGIGGQVALPALKSAVDTKKNVERWVAAQKARAEAERRAALAAAAQPIGAAPVWYGSLPAGSRIIGAQITFYACLGSGFCGNTASGAPTQPGVAACGYRLPMGTQFIVADDPTQTVFTCLDRGALGPTGIDVWFYDPADGFAWLSAVGTQSDIIIVN